MSSPADAPWFFLGLLWRTEDAPMTKVELLEKKGRLANEAKQILDTAHADGREALRKEEEDKFNALHTDIESISKHIALIAKQEDAERSLTEVSQRITQPNAVPSGPIES